MDLEQLINSYQPSEKTEQLIRGTRIALLVGITGAGKDTIKRQLLQKPEYRDIVSHTTRPPRVNNGVEEIPDVDYHFIDQTTARTMLEKQQFVEAKFVHGTVYGTAVAELQAAHDENKIAITDLDVQGVDEYQKISSSIVAIFIVPPDYDVWRQRLQARYKNASELAAEWPKRRDSAIMELNRALQADYYHFVINDDLFEAVKEVDKIIHQPESGRQTADARKLAEILLADIKASA